MKLGGDPAPRTVRLRDRPIMILRFRYRLRSLLLLTAVVALTIGHLVQQAAIEHAALAAVTDAEGWGYTGEDKPPWNVGPESTIAFSPACFFDVPEDFDVPDNPEFRMQFITASGTQFSHRFTKQAPRLRSATQASKRAA